MKKWNSKGIVIWILTFCLALCVLERCTQTTQWLAFKHTLSEKKQALLHRKAAELFIFVSLDMPLQSLKAWGDQAAPLGVPLLIRESPKRSSEKAAQKIAEISTENPELRIASQPEFFEKFNIQEFDLEEVPIVVLVVHQPRILSFLKPNIIKIEGSRSPFLALVRIFNRKGIDPLFVDAAYHFAYRLRG